MEAHTHEQAHGSVRNYILVLCILAVLTFMEVMASADINVFVQ